MFINFVHTILKQFFTITFRIGNYTSIIGRKHRDKKNKQNKYIHHSAQNLKYGKSYNIFQTFVCALSNLLLSQASKILKMDLVYMPVS